MEEFIRGKFVNGLPYNDLAQLCLKLYCSLESIPEQYHEECTKDGIAIIFANLCKEGFIINNECIEAIGYGANHHNVTEKGHWIEVMASIYKIGNTVDEVKSKFLSETLKG